MATYNGIIKKRNGSEWDNFLPVTMAENVLLDSETNAKEKFIDIDSQLAILKDVANVKYHGVKGDGVTNETEKIQSLLNTKEYLYFPKGVYCCNFITVPSTVKGIFGDGDETIIKLFDTTQTGIFITIANTNNSLISNFKIQGKNSQAKTLFHLWLNENNNLMLKNVTSNGANNISINATKNTNLLIDECKCIDFGQMGVYAEESTDSVISGCVVKGDSPTMHGIQLKDGIRNVIINNTVSNCGIFGINLFHEDYGKIANNNIYNTKKEAINLDNSSHSIIQDNMCVWFLPSISEDYGISIYGHDDSNSSFNVCTNNYVNYSGKSGINITDNATNNIIKDNTILEPNQLNETHGSGIYIVSSLPNNPAYFNEISNNYVYGGETSKCKFGVNFEENVGRCYVLNNVFRNCNTPYSFNSIYKNVYSGNIPEIPINYIPTVSSTSGTIANYTATKAIFTVNNQLCYFNLEIDIIDNGTGDGSLKVTLPLEQLESNFSLGVINGKENYLTGKSINGTIAGNALYLRLYDNTYCGGTNAKIIVNGYYNIKY